MRTAPEATKDDLQGTIARIRRSVPRMARTIIDRYIATSPLYTQTAVPEHLHRESAHTVRSLLEVCLQSITDESIDVADTMRENIERGTERVAEGLPLREYMRCWQIGFDVLSEELERELASTTDCSGSHTAEPIPRLIACYERSSPRTRSTRTTSFGARPKPCPHHRCPPARRRVGVRRPRLRPCRTEHHAAAHR